MFRVVFPNKTGLLRHVPSCSIDVFAPRPPPSVSQSPVSFSGRSRLLKQALDIIEDLTVVPELQESLRCSVSDGRSPTGIQSSGVWGSWEAGGC